MDGDLCDSRLVRMTDISDDANKRADPTKNRI
jgi:hypothetical protein